MRSPQTIMKQNFNLLALVVVAIMIGISSMNNVNAFTPAVYDLNTAVALSEFSGIAYCDSTSIKSWKCTGCDSAFSNIQVYSNLYQKTFVADNGKDTIIISFQGTNSENLLTWIKNIDAELITPKPSWCDGCLLHKGFYSIHSILFPLIRQDLNLRLKKLKNANVYLAGHSLGGALATYMGFDLLRTNTLSAKDLTLYTFGSPRIGNKNFAKAFNSAVKSCWRVVDNEDIVPHIPPAAFTDYNSGGTLVYCPVSNTKNCKIKYGAEDDGYWTHFSVSDHSLYLGVKIGTSAAAIRCPAPRFRSIALRETTGRDSKYDSDSMIETLINLDEKNLLPEQQQQQQQQRTEAKKEETKVKYNLAEVLPEAKDVEDAIAEAEAFLNGKKSSDTTNIIASTDISKTSDTTTKPKVIVIVIAAEEKSEIILNTIPSSTGTNQPEHTEQNKQEDNSRAAVPVPIGINIERESNTIEINDAAAAFTENEHNDYYHDASAPYSIAFDAAYANPIEHQN